MADFMNAMVGGLQSSQPIVRSESEKRNTAFSGITSVLGGLSSIAASRSQASRQEREAALTDQEVGREELAGKSSVISELRQLNEDLAQINVAGGASGISGQGSFISSSSEASRFSGQRLRDINFGTGSRQRALIEQGRQQRFDADQTRAGGLLGFGQAVGEFGASLRRRG